MDHDPGYTSSIQAISDTSYKVSISEQGQLLSFAQVIEAWSGNHAFIDDFAFILKSSPYAAYFWEMPAVTRNTLDRDFECVIINSAVLAGMRVNRRAFSAYFETAASDQSVVSFPNIGKDAQLVVPCPRDDVTNYSHLGGFMRSAPAAQVEALWREVGEQASRIIQSTGDTWISTAGTGVGWLHVRFDTFPKYYSHTPYRQTGT